MGESQTELTPRERELGAIILQYNEVTERLKESYEALQTEVERLRAELERKNRELERRERLAALGQMAAGLAHEIRNPLGGIQLYASLLRKDLVESEEQLGVVRKIDRGVKLIEGLVSDVLTFARPSAPQAEGLLLRDSVRDVVELIGPKLEQNAVELRWDEPSCAIGVWADPRQLQQILTNVLTNCIEAITQRPERRPHWVSVMARTDAEHGDGVEIVIADSGPGIDADALHRVFNPFFTTKDTGTGLGLAIVHQLVEAHGGSITAGRHPDGGAMFTIRLPRRPAAKTESD